MMRWLRAEMKLVSEHRNSTRFSSSSSKAVRTTSPRSSTIVAPWLSSKKRRLRKKKENRKHVCVYGDYPEAMDREGTHATWRQCLTWPSETDKSGFRFLSLCSFFFQKDRVNPLRAAKAGGGSDLLDLLLPLLLGCVLRDTLAVISFDRHSGSAASRQQKWSNNGSWWQGFSKKKDEMFFGFVNTRRNW